MVSDDLAMAWADSSLDEAAKAGEGAAQRSASTSRAARSPDSIAPSR